MTTVKLFAKYYNASDFKYPKSVNPPSIKPTLQHDFCRLKNFPIASKCKTFSILNFDATKHCNSLSYPTKNDMHICVVKFETYNVIIFNSEHYINLLKTHGHTHYEQTILHSLGISCTGVNKYIEIDGTSVDYDSSDVLYINLSTFKSISTLINIGILLDKLKRKGIILLIARYVSGPVRNMLYNAFNIVVENESRFILSKYGGSEAGVSNILLNGTASCLKCKHFAKFGGKYIDDFFKFKITIPTLLPPRMLNTAYRFILPFDPEYLDRVDYLKNVYYVFKFIKNKLTTHFNKIVCLDFNTRNGKSNIYMFNILGDLIFVDGEVIDAALEQHPHWFILYIKALYKMTCMTAQMDQTAANYRRFVKNLSALSKLEILYSMFDIQPLNLAKPIMHHHFNIARDSIETYKLVTNVIHCIFDDKAQQLTAPQYKSKIYSTEIEEMFRKLDSQIYNNNMALLYHNKLDEFVLSYTIVKKVDYDSIADHFWDYEEDKYSSWHDNLFEFAMFMNNIPDVSCIYIDKHSTVDIKNFKINQPNTIFIIARSIYDMLIYQHDENLISEPIYNNGPAIDVVAHGKYEFAKFSNESKSNTLIFYDFKNVKTINIKINNPSSFIFLLKIYNNINQ